MNRKHHCRFCGHVICSKCSKHRVVSKRICDECHAKYVEINTESNKDPIKYANHSSIKHKHWSLDDMKEELTHVSDMLHSQIIQQYQQLIEDGIYDFDANDTNEMQKCHDDELGRYRIFKAWDFWQLQLTFSSCSCLDDCDSLKRLLFILNIYHQWADSKKCQSAMSMLDIISILQTYSMENIFNDYMHIKEYHGLDALNHFLHNDMKKDWWFEIDGICYHIEYFSTRKCIRNNAINCAFVRKIFGDHNECNDECLCYIINTKFMSCYLGSQCRDDLIQRNTYLGYSKGNELECVQLLDMVHCFLFHNQYIYDDKTKTESMNYDEIKTEEYSLGHYIDVIH